MSFELEKTLLHLYELEQRTTSPEEPEAIRTAKIALDFVSSMGELQGFEDYLEHFKSDCPQRPLVSFATREEADTWLEKQPEPPPPAVVVIGSELYFVGYSRRRQRRVLIRIPTQQELGAGAST